MDNPSKKRRISSSDSSSSDDVSGLLKVSVPDAVITIDNRDTLEEHLCTSSSSDDDNGLLNVSVSTAANSSDICDRHEHLHTSSSSDNDNGLLDVSVDTAADATNGNDIFDRVQEHLYTSSSSDDDNGLLNVSVSTAAYGSDICDRLQEHLELPSSPLRSLELSQADSLQERVDLHMNVVNPASLNDGSQSIPAASADPVQILDTTFDDLDERVTRHFQILDSASKLDQSFASLEHSPSNQSLNCAVDSNLKMPASRAITFEGLLPDATQLLQCTRGNNSTSPASSKGNDDMETSSSSSECSTDSVAPSEDSDATSISSSSRPNVVTSGGDLSSDEECGSDINLPIDIDVFRQDENEDCSAFDHSKMSLTKALHLNDIKLHPYTEKSVNQGILKVMQLYLNNHDSKSGLQRLLSTTCSLLPEKHLLPSSSHKILKYIRSLAPPIPASTHYYCKDCLIYHGTNINGQCAVCSENNENDDESLGSKFNHFFTFDIGATLKYLFECRNLASAIDVSCSRTEVPGVYSDIQDGSEYKRLNANRNPYDITLVMNSDGVRIRDSSDKELWIFMFSVIEVPVPLRESYIIFGAVWYDKPKPKMNTFLRPSCEELKKLHNEGLDWKHRATGNIKHSTVQVAVGVFDAPGRAMTQNTLLFNGENGCNMCEIQTIRSAPIPGKKAIRVYPHVENLVYRTKETMEAQAREALERNVTHVKGVKGPSVLSIVPSIDISKFFIPEYMHSVLLGVMKQMLTIWTTLSGPWNIKYCLSEIDHFLAAVKHPDFVHKAPRVLSRMKFMKASDFYYFLLFEALPALQGRLPVQFFQHFILLVKGIYLLLMANVKECEIEEADRILQLFVQQFQNLYTDRQLTSNIHSLCHLALVVKRFGPLSCNNAFIFENMNGLIGKSTHGTKNVATEIVNNIRIAQGVQVLKNIVTGLLDAQSWHINHIAFTAEVLGKCRDVNICAQEAELLGASALIFSRARIESDIFTSEIHKKLSTENFHVMFDDNKYAAIKYFAKTENALYVCLKLYKVDHLKVFYHLQTRTSISHLIPVVSTDEIVVKDVKETSFTKVGKIGCFLFKRPNLLHGAVN